MKDILTRLQIAEALEVSTDTVARREKEFGLSACRRKGNGRLVLYVKSEANAALLKRGSITEAIP